LKSLPNHLLIEGHTDAQPYSSDLGYTNWELSSDRANAARRILQQDGIRATQVSQVRGYADQSLRIPANPLDPSNRRISLIVQWVTSADQEAPVTTSNAPPPSATPESSASEKARPAAAPDSAASTPPDSAAPPRDASTKPAPAIPTPTTAPPPTKAPNSFAGTWIGRIKTLLPSKK
jgi:chemotaxis protein MotB